MHTVTFERLETKALRPGDLVLWADELVLCVAVSLRAGGADASVMFLSSSGLRFIVALEHGRVCLVQASQGV